MQAARTKRRGFTLAEVLISAALAFLLSGLVARAWIQLSRASQVTLQSLEVRSPALLAQARIARLLRGTAIEGVQVVSSGGAQALSLDTVMTLSSAASRSWSNQLHLFRWNPTRSSLEHLQVEQAELARADLSIDGVVAVVPSPNQLVQFSGQVVERFAMQNCRFVYLSNKAVQVELTSTSPGSQRPGLVVRRIYRLHP